MSYIHCKAALLLPVMFLVAFQFFEPARATAQASSSSGPSLQETLSWLKEFLPDATGAKFGNGEFVQVRTTMSLVQVNGCEVNIAEIDDVYDKGLLQPSLRLSVAFRFSFGDIEPRAIAVRTDTMKGTPPPRIAVAISTRNNSPTISIDSQGKTSHEYIGAFVDLASAQRVANALKHAAELCESRQPF